MTRTPRKLITRKQAAERAGVDPRTIDRWRRLGLLSTHPMPGLRVRVWIDPAELDRIINPVVPAQRKASA